MGGLIGTLGEFLKPETEAERQAREDQAAALELAMNEAIAKHSETAGATSGNRQPDVRIVRSRERPTFGRRSNAELANEDAG